MANAQINQSETCEMLVSDLTPNPENAVFPDLSSAELKVLKADIRKNGLQHPIEILPDGTVLCGHQRLRAVKLLKWEKVTCIVRHDLAERGPDAQKAYLVRDNLNRRNLTTLQIARVLIANMDLMDEMSHGCPMGRESHPEMILSLIMDRTGRSRKTAQRWYHVASTPIPIQDAAEEGELKLVDADKVSHLKWAVQEEIARRIDAGEAAKDVVNEVLGKRPARSKGRMAKALKGTFTKFLQRIEVEAVGCGEVEDLLRHIPDLIGQMQDMQEKLEARLPALLQEREEWFEQNIQPRLVNDCEEPDEEASPSDDASTLPLRPQRSVRTSLAERMSA